MPVLAFFLVTKIIHRISVYEGLTLLCCLNFTMKATLKGEISAFFRKLCKRYKMLSR